MNSEKETRKGLIVRSKIFMAVAFTWIFFLSSQSACFASTVVLQWDAETDPNVIGYKVYYQADSSSLPFQGTGATQGVAPVDTHNLTTATISGLDPAHAYYFAVTAYNASGMESAYSNIVPVPELISPTASLSYPVANSSVSGSVSVTASASDNVGVTKVEFYVNGVLQASDTATPYLYSWNTTSLTSGSYILMVKAYDIAGNIGQSSNVTVTVVNDITAPTVSVTAPANNATVSGTTTITASASDNVGVSKVEFYENGILLSATNVSPYNYSWNTTSVANGSYTLTAKAFDSVGNVGQSSNVAVIVSNPVPDTIAPTISVTTPASNAKVSGTTSFTATAADNVGVTKVEFYVNGTLQATDTASPYSFSWNTTTVPNAIYVLSTKAYDAAGNVGKSSTISVTVFNDTTAPTVSVTAPASNAKVSGTTSFTATAADNVGVTKVEFYVNGTLQATDTASPYSFSWNTTTVPNAIYVLSTKAYDAAGNVGKSSTVSVTVSNDVNISSQASVTASSQNSSTGQLASKAVDGVIDGYGGNPGDYTKEWATLGQLAGAWIQLKWSKAFVVNKIVLYDRPNLTDQVLGGTLTFSDGTSVTVGQLTNSGTGNTITFTPKTVSWIKLTITKAQGSNIGLSEFKVFGH